jgi:hypothetical protein
MTKEQRRKSLRTALYGNVQYDTLELLLSDEFGVTRLLNVVRATVSYEAQCHDLVLWVEGAGQLETFCRALQRYEKTKDNLVLQAVVTAVLESLRATAAAPPGSAPGRQLLLNRRPFLNRQTLWTKLGSFAAGSGADRLLLVRGEEASGKSYSEYLISYFAAPSNAAFVSVDAPAVAQGELEAPPLAARIAARFGGEATGGPIDDLSQAARQGKWHEETLIPRLANLRQPTWLMIDGLNKVPLGRSALDLLIRLCRAVELNECPELWLILVGLNGPELGSRYDGFIPDDEACAPKVEDVKEFIRVVATSAGKQVGPEALDEYATELCTTLGAKPSHASWTAFHRRLADKCRKITLE